MAYFQSAKGSEIVGTMQVFLQFYIVLLLFSYPMGSQVNELRTEPLSY